MLEICTRLNKFGKIYVTAFVWKITGQKELQTMQNVSTETYITTEVITSFRSYLISEEKSEFTVDKYIRDADAFSAFLSGEPLSKEKVLAYKSYLMECGKFADSSINSMISSIRALLKFIGRSDCAVSNLRIQELPFNPEEKNLTQDEFERLLDAAKDNRRLHLLLLVMFSTGIRVSEVKYFTVESFKNKLDKVRITVRCKKKNRRVIVADELKREVMEYIKKNKIESGPIFRTRSGNPLDRSAIWKQMKRLCAKAKVAPSKVFPHNLRKLFARNFYAETHDIVQLAALLGHSSINTTKIYVKTTEEEVRKHVEMVVNKLLFAKRKATLSA